MTECGFCDDGLFRHPGTHVSEPCPYCHEAAPSDEMTCDECGGVFKRREGVDTPVPLCPWCFIHAD